MASEPQFAEGIDAEQVRPLVDALLEKGWKLDDDGMGVLKTYYFKTYFKAVVCFVSWGLDLSLVSRER